MSKSGLLLSARLLALCVGLSQAKTLNLNNDAEWLVEYTVNNTAQHFVKMYLFNLTNPDEFLNGAKPRFNEMGPYVFKETWERSNFRWNGDGEVEYDMRLFYRFLPRRSKGNRQTDEFTTINIPFVTALHTETSPISRRAIGSLLQIKGLKLYRKLIVREFLFGYDDPIIALGRSVNSDPSKRYPYEKFGLLAGWNGTVRHRMTINTGLTNNGVLGELTKVNGRPNLGIWQRDSEADRVQGSEGIMFKPNVLRNERLHLFSSRLCRALPLEYERDVTSRSGLNAMRFSTAKDAFSASGMRNSGFCVRGSCDDMPDGVMNMGPCQRDAPILLSLPHFLGGDRSLVNSVEGLRPSPEKHQTFIDVTPAGPTVKAKVAVQLNMKVSKVDDVSQARGLRDIIIPLAYMISESSTFKDPAEKRRFTDVVTRNA